MSRRALTLVEVLAATVLLTMLAATCMPLLRKALRTLHQPQAPFEYLELGQLADSFLADPSAFGVDGLDQVDLEIAWPEHSDRPPVLVHLLMSADPAATHAWLAFSSWETSVFRPVALPRGEEADR